MPTDSRSADAAVIALRAHHLVCMLTYIGKGYTPGFVSNYDRIVAAVDGGCVIRIVEGPDDICEPLARDENAHCHRCSVDWRDRQAATALSDLLGRDFNPGASIGLDDEDVRQMRQAFQHGKLRAPCTGCQWNALCTGVAAAGFKDARIKPSAVPPEACS